MQFNLDGLKMNAIKTDPNGIIGPETIFSFTQKNNVVRAEYSGGRIQHGYLIGILNGSKLHFRYCQLQTTGELDSGESNCELRFENNLIQIIENFAWESRPGTGQNIIQQLSN